MFRLLSWFLILAIFLFATACTSPDKQVDPTAGNGESIVDGAERSTLEAHSGGTAEITQDLDSARISTWHSFAGAIDGLRSFSRQMTISFVPEREDSDSQSWQIESTYQFSKVPSMEIYELNYQGSTHGLDTPALSFIANGINHYLVIPQGGCLEVTEKDIAHAKSGILDPDYFLDEVDEIKRIGTETVNGQPVDHYEFDRHLLRKDSFQEVVVGGDIYLSQTGNIPVRLNLIVSGRGDFSGAGRIEEGTLSINLDLNRLNAPTEISLPPSCSDAILYPLPADSYRISVIDDLLSYRVRLSIGEIISYYQIEMEAAGYRLTEDPTVTEDMAYMTFAKAGQEFIVQIEEGPEPGEVSVLISP